MERHLPDGITQCCLPPNTGKRTRLQPCSQRVQYLIYHTQEGWKAELNSCCLHTKMVHLSADSHPSK